MKNLLLISAFLLAFTNLSCGGGNKAPEIAPYYSSRQADYSLHTPNYGNTLIIGLGFGKSIVTYRIVDFGGRDIQNNPLNNIPFANIQKNEIRNAFAKWEDSTTVKFIETDEVADIEFVLQEKSDFNANDNRDQLGRTDWYVNSGYLQRSVTRLSNNLPERTFRLTVLHEVGHAIGIRGHSNNFTDVMYNVSPLIIREIELSRRDKNTMKCIYHKE